MKVALCVISKWEEQYLKEFVEHYKSIGFNNILFYDNNELNDDGQYNILKPYIDDGFVIYHDWRGLGSIKTQRRCYQKCIDTFYNNYDWIAFFDVDEFLELGEYKTIQDFINSNKNFNNFDCIGINWYVSDDNDLIYNDGSPLHERFTRFKPSTYYKVILNMNKHVLSKKVKSVHNIILTSKICNIEGTIMNIKTNVHTYSFNDKIVLKHYRWKTVEEFCKKVKRGYINVIRLNTREQIDDTIRKFFKCNEKTMEKENFIKNYFKDVNLN